MPMTSFRLLSSFLARVLLVVAAALLIVPEVDATCFFFCVPVSRGLHDGGRASIERVFRSFDDRPPQSFLSHSLGERESASLFLSLAPVRVFPSGPRVSTGGKRGGTRREQIPPFGESICQNAGVIPARLST